MLKWIYEKERVEGGYDGNEPWTGDQILQADEGDSDTSRLSVRFKLPRYFVRRQTDEHDRWLCGNFRRAFRSYDQCDRIGGHIELHQATSYWPLGLHRYVCFGSWEDINGNLHKSYRRKSSDGWTVFGSDLLFDLCGLCLLSCRDRSPSPARYAFF